MSVYPNSDALADKDRRRAGIAKKDAGNSADFHSLRYFFCTTMGEKLPIQRVRILMRHRDIRTTCNLYMQLGPTDAAEEGWSPPGILR